MTYRLILAGMPGGVLEERLRDYVKRRLKRRTTAVNLARHLVETGLRKSEKEATVFVSLYKSGERDADLDTAVEIAAFFKQPLPALIGDRPLVEVPEIDQDPDVVGFRALPSDDQKAVRLLINTLRRHQAKR